MHHLLPSPHLTTLSHCRELHFTSHPDPSGQLGVIEQGVPFAIRRVYHLQSVPPGARRGEHAHRRLQQVLVCLRGSCRLLLDDGKEQRAYWLDSPERGVYMAPGIWGCLSDFTPDALLLVLASEVYQEEDYLRAYADFLAFKN